VFLNLVLKVEVNVSAPAFIVLGHDGRGWRLGSLVGRARLAGLGTSRFARVFRHEIAHLLKHTLDSAELVEELVEVNPPHICFLGGDFRRTGGGSRSVLAGFRLSLLGAGQRRRHQRQTRCERRVGGTIEPTDPGGMTFVCEALNHPHFVSMNAPQTGYADGITDTERSVRLHGEGDSFGCEGACWLSNEFGDLSVSRGRMFAPRLSLISNSRQNESHAVLGRRERDGFTNKKEEVVARQTETHKCG